MMQHRRSSRTITRQATNGPSLGEQQRTLTLPSPWRKRGLRQAPPAGPGACSPLLQHSARRTFGNRTFGNRAFYARGNPATTIRPFASPASCRSDCGPP